MRTYNEVVMHETKGIKSGDWVILEGITRHGKNRIQQHGEKWLVESISDFNGRPAMSLRSEKKTFKHGDKWVHDGRMVHLFKDINFNWKMV
jgi:hypothetical protein